MSETRWRAFRRRTRVALAVRVGSLAARVLGSTWRYTLVGREALDRRRRDGGPVIFALWHGELLPCLWLHRGEGIVVLISTHSDGEIIARIAESFGYRTVRGSSSRGGARAVLDIEAELNSGHDVAFTPDGPRGPRHVFAPGALAVAQRTGIPIVCGRIQARRAWLLSSWDRFMIPKPFARITVTYSETEFVTGASVRDVEAVVPRFAQIMRRLAEPNGD